MAAVHHRPPISGGIDVNGDCIKPPAKKHTFMLSGVPFELDEKYAPVRVLGRGAYGVVCSCINRVTGEYVAVKRIWNALSERTFALRTVREMQILRELYHENVISIEDVMVSSSPLGKADFQHVYLVQEQMDTNLQGLIQRTPNLSDDHIQHFLFQILKGLNYLHSANVLHRDLKPENVLVNWDNLDLKICDFGLARTKHDAVGQFMTEDMTSLWYRAPEILLGSDRYGNEVDIWSAGCIFAEMLGGSGVPIFKGREALSQIREILQVVGTPRSDSELRLFIDSKRAREYIMVRLPFSPGQSFRDLFREANPLGIDLLKRMLTLNPEKRISAMEALEHPYFSDTRLYHPIPTKSVKRLRLEVDDIPELVDLELSRNLIWDELLLYHPELIE